MDEAAPWGGTLQRSLVFPRFPYALVHHLPVLAPPDFVLLVFEKLLAGFGGGDEGGKGRHGTK